MKEALMATAVGVLGLGGILYATVTNAEVKGYTVIMVAGANVMKNILQSMEHSANS